MEIYKLLDPIGKEQPAGEDVRYDPLFEELQSELDKLNCPSAAGSVDWEGVAQRAAHLLAERSKDLVVTSYLAVALLHTRGGDGVLPALELYHGILERFWEELYPAARKERGRVLALEWWLEKSLRALHLAQVRLEPPQRAIALELLEKIDALLGERLPAAASLEPLRRYFAQERETEAGTAAEETAQCAPEQDRGLRAPQEPVADGEEKAPQDSPLAGDRDLEGALQRAWCCALLLRRDDPANPVPYRVLRQAAWSTVAALPPALEGRTRIAAPDHQQTALLRELRRKGGAERVVEAAESRLPHGIFWLDLNRLSCEALGELGDAFCAAQEAIVQETSHLLARLPGLTELCFSDGTPFADAETRRWLQQAASPVPPPLRIAPPTVVDPPETEHAAALSKALEEARLLAVEGKLPEGVALLHDTLHTLPSGRERLLWRLALVEFLLSSGGAAAAPPQLELVLGELDRHALDIYDPAVALPALKLAYAGFRSQREALFKEKALDALSRIGRLDPAEMVRLEQGGRPAV